MKRPIRSVRTLAGAVIATCSLTAGVHGALITGSLITFGNSDVDPLDASGTVLEDGFTYQAFGSAWDITTSLGNPGASLVTAWNGDSPAIGQTVEILAADASPFVFVSLDFRTLNSFSSYDLTVSGYFEGGTVGQMLLDENSTTFLTKLPNFSGPIDRLVIEVTGDGSNAAAVDNISLRAIPEPSAALLAGLGAFALIAGRRRII